jgi:hypothetical protein
MFELPEKISAFPGVLRFVHRAFRGAPGQNVEGLIGGYDVAGTQHELRRMS